MMNRATGISFSIDSFMFVACCISDSIHLTDQIGKDACH